MKKIYINEKGVKGKKPYLPFWMPWGVMGCFGRAFLFLLALLVFLWLLSLPRGCASINIGQDSVYVRTDSIEPGEPVEWPTSKIDTVPELPKNPIIEPIDSSIIITSPDSLTQIASNRLNVFLDKQDDQTLVKFAKRFKEVFPSNAYRITFYDPLSYLLQIVVPEIEREDLKKTMPKLLPDFSFILFDEGLYGANKIPDDSGFAIESVQDYYAAIQAFDAWNLTMGSPDVVVAVVDNFFDLNHPELQGEIVQPFNYTRHNTNVYPPSPSPLDRISHGSHVASLAIGRANNANLACGIAPKCKFMPISVGDDALAHDYGSTLQIMECVLYAIYHGADVVNMSIGRSFEGLQKIMSPEEQIEFAKTIHLEEAEVWNYITDVAVAHNCVLVRSAGNDTVFTGLDCAKRSPHLITVSSVDATLNRAFFSNFGCLENGKLAYSTISAPGVDILGAIPGIYDGLFEQNFGMGTSLSAPIVTGAVALLKSLNRELTPDEIIRILQETGKPLPAEECVGNLLQIRNALDRVKSEFNNSLLLHPEKLIGRWECTEKLMLTSTKKPIKLYMEFPNTKEGTLICEEQNTSKQYRAPLQVKFGKKGVELVQLKEAVNAKDQDVIIKYDFHCTANKELLQCVGVNVANNKRVSFCLKKLK